MAFLLPGELTAFIDEYIGHYRRALLALRRRGVSPRDAGDALWVSDDGGPLRYDAIYEIVIRITEQAFGRSVYPHLFRDCAATSTETRDPEHVGIVPLLLGHTSFATSEQHYLHARSYEAARRWQANMLSLANEPKSEIGSADHDQSDTAIGSQSVGDGPNRLRKNHLPEPASI